MAPPRNRLSRRAIVASLAAAPAILRAPALLAAAAPDKFVLAFHVTISPSWFDPSTAPPQITPFGMLYAIHDALVRPYPGHKMGPSLAESWSESEDGLTYEFKLRPNVKFHNGDPVTAEDVKFSFDRYKGAAASVLHEHVKEVEIVDPRTVRFHLKEAWPDFMTFYGTPASGAGLVVPKKYMTEVGEDGFKKHPIGAGPYKFVSTKPGIEVVLEANTRLLAQGSECEDAGHAQRTRGDHAGTDGAHRRVRYQHHARRPGRRGAAEGQVSRSSRQSTPRSSGSSSPSNGTRNHRGMTNGCGDAVNYALNRAAINQAACLGFCPPAGVIVPRVMDFALQTEPVPYDPKKAKQLLAEAGYPKGFDAGEFAAIPGFPTVADAVVNDLNAAGIRVSARARWSAPRSTRTGSRRNCRRSTWSPPEAPATRPPGSKSFIYSKGEYASGGYPDIDELYLQQATERDPKKREEMLDKIQQMTIDRTMFAPVYGFAHAERDRAESDETYNRRCFPGPVSGL